MTWRDYFQLPPVGRHPQEERVLIRNFVAILGESVAQSFLALPVFGLVMYGHMPLAVIALWVGVFLLHECVFAWLLWRFRRDGPAAEMRRYLDLREWMAFSAALWGSMMLCMFPVDAADPYRMVVLLWLAGSFSVITLLLAPCRDLHLIYFVGYWAYPLYRFTSETGTLYDLLLLGIGLFVLVEWQFVSDFHQIMFQTARLRRSNQGLMASLQALNDDLQAKHEELERQQQALRSALEERQRLAESDALTGCLNQRALRSQLTRCAEQSWQRHAEWGVAMLDLDWFKQVNDSYGHLVGDEVLRQVAKLIEQRLADGMLLARYGGEEFVVLSPRHDGLALLAVMEDVRLTLATTVFNGLPADRPQTVSIGVTGCQPGEPVQNCLRRADQALYHAKRSGRNRVCLAEEIEPSGP